MAQVADGGERVASLDRATITKKMKKRAPSHYLAAFASPISANALALLCSLCRERWRAQIKSTT
jgi:hypothetical protein